MEKIKIPKLDKIEEIEIMRSLVALGANGAGKTKLALHLYQNNYKGKSHLIGAHNKLEIDEQISLYDFEASKKIFKYGHKNGSENNLFRWSTSRNPFKIIDDYSKTLSYLFANQKKCNQEYTDEARKKHENGEKIEKPKDFHVEKAQNIWNRLISHREMDLKRDNVYVSDKQGNEYHGKTMSDGEKYALYVIAQVLCLEEGTLIIVDEPEHYLNKGILYELWDLLEDERSDCKFLYITHDIDFAVSRRESKKIWLKSYENNQWDWEEILQDENLPEEMVLKILGNKKKILFTEGEKGGAEEKLFSMIYKDYKVIPLRTCNEVIRALNGIKTEQFPGYSFKGIIDRDYWRDEYLDSLSKNKVHVLKVAEIENLFITKEVMSLYCKVSDEDSNLVLEAVERIFEEAEKVIEIQCINKIRADIKNSLQNVNLDRKKKKIEDITANLKEKLGVVISDVESDYEKVIERYSKIVEEKDFNELLKIYNHKGFIKLASQKLGVNCIKEKILKIMRNNPKKREKFILEFEKSLPSFEEK